jgi:transposase InsO family protein
VWRIYRDNHRWSVFGKKRGRGKKAGPPVHDDPVSRNFTATGPNRLRLADITEHGTGQGKLYLCAIQDVFGNRIVGCSIDARIKSRLAVAALDNAVARRERVDGCTRHGNRGSEFRSRKFVRASTTTGWPDRQAESGRLATTRHWSPSSACLRRTSSAAGPGHGQFEEPFVAAECGCRSEKGQAVAGFALVASG